MFSFCIKVWSHQYYFNLLNSYTNIFWEVKNRLVVIENDRRIKNKQSQLSNYCKKRFQQTGHKFLFTPNDYSQQLAFMNHPAGKEICPHIHKKVQRRSLLYLRNFVYS